MREGERGGEKEDWEGEKREEKGGKGEGGGGEGEEHIPQRFLHFTKRLLRSKNEIKPFSVIQKLKQNTTNGLFLKVIPKDEI